MTAALQCTAVADDAAALLDLLAPGEPETFQTFGEGTAKGAHGLTRTLHGTLAEHRETLAALNARGAGAFWTVNATDGGGRKASNVQRVRALFVDLDGAPVAPVQTSPLPPHAIVESSPGRWHAYWRIADCGLGDFTPMQKALAKRFDADPKVCDLPRVMRLPGFLHRKHDPFESRIVSLREAPPYRLADFRQAFGFDDATPVPHALPLPARPRGKLADAIPAGERNTTLLSLAAGLVRKGYGAQGVNDRLQRINAERCMPPLGADEVDAIAARATGYGSDGFAMLPHALLDSPAWLALPAASCAIVLAFYRRFDGSNNGRLCVSWSDFEGHHGIGTSRRFYRYLRLAVLAGFLIQTEAPRNRQTGRVPGMFAIPEPYLAQVSKQHMGPTVKTAHLHR